MTNQQGAPEALRTIQRYKIGYATDDWGMRSSTPSGIPDHAGAWVRYEDHIAALVEAQQPATHVQNPAEIEHVAGDVSKNGPESNMAQQPAPSAAVALSDDLRDRLVAISAAIADQDYRAAQAMLREILAAPQPSPTPQADSQPAPVLDREAFELWARPRGLQLRRNEALGHYGNIDTQRCWEGWQARAPADSVTAPAGGVVAREMRNLHPEKCPITGRPFFMTLDHPELGSVPTYGGPYDSYTIPAPEGEPTDPWHERDLRSERYDHDAGWWVEGGEPIPLRIVHEDVLFKLQEDAEAPPAQAADSVLEDAARYRWLRNPTTDVALVLDKRTGYVPVDEQVPSVGGYYTYEYRSGDELDAAVDAARKQGGSHD